MKEHCRNCNKETETAYCPERGHIAQNCAVCGWHRLGAPFITKRKYAKLVELKLIPAISATPDKGERHDYQNQKI